MVFIVPMVVLVIIIIKKETSCTGNWDFGKLKGGDNEFHSLRTYQTAIERASNRRLLAPPDHTLHCGQKEFSKVAIKKLKQHSLMCDWVFNKSKRLPFVLQVNDIKLATFANSFPPLCIVVLCVWHSTYGKLNCFDFGMALLCSKKYEVLLEKNNDTIHSSF